MAIARNVADNELKKFVESSTVSGQPIVVVGNPDGTAISAGGGGAATQYTEGDVDTTITGTAFLWEDASDILRPVSAAKPLPVSGPLTDAQLRATAVPVSGTFWQATQPVSAASLPLPTGAATSANQSSILTELGDKLDELTFTARLGEVQASPTANTLLARLKTIADTLAGTLVVDVTDTAFNAVQSGTWTVGLSAGTNNIGDVDVLSLPALPAGTNNIGDVDIASFPASTLAGATSKNLDYDSGAGADNLGIVGLALPKSGGAVAGGTSTDPIRTDPTGATAQPVTGTFWQATQPVSGPLTDAQLRATAVPVSGTFYQATQPVSGTVTANQGTPTNWTFNAAQIGGVAPNMNAGNAGAGTQRVVLASDQPAIAVTGTFWQATQPVSGTVTATGPLTDAQLRAAAVPVSGTFWQATQPVSGPLTDAQLRATAVPISGTVTANVGSGTQPVSGTVTANAGTGTFTTREVRAATPTQTSPSVTTTSTSILASNANRLGATVWNEGAAECYIKVGATASTTSYSVRMTLGTFFEIPFNYTGAIDGITSSGTAQLRVTELA